jgi:amino acid transporter
VLLVTSLFAALLSFHNVLARYFFALGGSGALPAACGRSHPRHRSPHIGSTVQSVSALVLVALFALIGLDPVTQVFAWMAGTATLGVLALMALTCLAVLVFFRRTRADVRPWQTVVAPVLGLLGLATFLFLTITNFPTLIGGSPGLAAAIGAVLVVFFAAGVLWALARRSPTVPSAPAPVADPV